MKQQPKLIKPNYIDKGAEISEDRQYRYSLWRIWDTTKPLILFIMLNPSTADGDKDDRTISRVVDYCCQWGYGGVYVVNLFAKRATDPGVLKRLVHQQYTHGYKIVVGENNDKAILQANMKCDRVVFAWGRYGKWYNRANEVIDLFKEAFYIKLSTTGAPCHPLFLKRDLILKPFIKNNHQ